MHRVVFGSDLGDQGGESRCRQRDTACVEGWRSPDFTCPLRSCHRCAEYSCPAAGRAAGFRGGGRQLQCLPTPCAGDSVSPGDPVRRLAALCSPAWALPVGKPPLPAGWIIKCDRDERADGGCEYQHVSNFHVLFGNTFFPPFFFF